jgi:predicted peptidase
MVILATSSSGTVSPKDAKAETASVSAAGAKETVRPSDTFIEQKNTFSYHNEKIQYMLILPAAYSKTSSQWPLILFLHGASGRGENLDLVKSYGPPLIAEEQPDFPFVVLAPQCPEGQYWTNNREILAALLDDIFKQHRIDQERVYLTGMSMGGNGTWDLASQHPEYFAAIAPLAASPKLPDIWLKPFTSLPIWAFHGEQDPICPLQDDEAMIRALRARGATPRFTVLPDKGHYISAVYKDRNLYEWFLANTRQH